MKIKKKLLLITIINLIALIGLSQSKATIDNVDFHQYEDNIIINYDILKAESDETFTIWVKVNSTKGRAIQPKSLEGDIGKNIHGGRGKKIIWKVKDDNISLDEEITIEVLGKPEKTHLQPIENRSEVKTAKKVSVPAAMGLSLILPGLGNTYAKKGGPYWLIGISGYGMIAGSIILNNSAYNAYEDYKDESDSDKRKDFYNKAKRNNNISKYLIYGAAGIWVLDIIWTGIQAARVKRKNNASRAMVYPTYNPVNHCAEINLTIRF